MRKIEKFPDEITINQHKDMHPNRPFTVHGDLFEKINSSEFASNEEAMPTRLASGNIQRLIRDINPTERRQQTRRAQNYVKSDELLGRIIKLKVDNTSSGLSFLPKNKDATEKEKYQEQKDEIETFVDEHDLEKVIEDLLNDWYVTDSMILYWRTPGLSSEASTPTDEALSFNGVENLCAIDPKTVDWDNSLGKDKLYIDIAEDIIKRINEVLTQYRTANNEEKQKAIAALQKEGIGLKWILAVQARKTVVELTKEDGDNWIIHTKARKYHGLAEPSMKSIFMALEQRAMLDEGAFSGSLLVKHFIMVMKQGESITQGPLAGQRKNWLTADEAKELLKAMSGVNKAMKIAVNHTTEFEFVLPPDQLFSLEKFERCEFKIMIWAGVPMVLVTGEGGNYSGGYIGIRPLLSDISKARNIISRIMGRFFKHETVKSVIKDYMISVSFNENILKEPRQILDEIKFLFTSSVLDQESALRELNRDVDAVKAGKRNAMKDNNEEELWEPVGGQDTGFGFNSGNQMNENDKRDDNQQGGRPSNDSTTENERTRTQAPTT